MSLDNNVYFEVLAPSTNDVTNEMIAQHILVKEPLGAGVCEEIEVRVRMRGKTRRKVYRYDFKARKLYTGPGSLTW